MRPIQLSDFSTPQFLQFRTRVFPCLDPALAKCNLFGRPVGQAGRQTHVGSLPDERRSISLIGFAERHHGRIFRVEPDGLHDLQGAFLAVICSALWTAPVLASGSEVPNVPCCRASPR